MKKIIKPSTLFWIGCCTLFIGHQISQKWIGWHLPFIDSFLDPLLAIPILLGGFFLERQIIFQQQQFRFSVFEIIVSTLFFAILFEEGFPYWSEKFTSDKWDYIAYFLGSLLFYLTAAKTCEIDNR